MIRSRLYDDWARFYRTRGVGRALVQSMIEGRLRRLVGQMRRLGKSTEAYVGVMPRRRLNVVLGMSVGVHQQLLGRLSSGPSGGYTGREGGREYDRMKASERLPLSSDGTKSEV